MNKSWIGKILALVLVFSLTLTACGGQAKPQSITVLLPPWAQIPKDMLDDFTAKTGITVNLTIADWDAIRDKIAVAGAAHTYLADVAEFDWSWTGQYTKAGWFLPLENEFDKSLLDDLVTKPAFTTDGHLYAIPYSNDFRIATYNKKMFQAAGIANPPTTFDELFTDMQTIKNKGTVDYPLVMDLSPTESTTQAWYVVVVGMGGELFDSNFNPQWSDTNSGAYKALKWLADAYQAGLASPGSLQQEPPPEDRFRAGENAYMYNSGAGELAIDNDPQQSTVAGDAAFALIPGGKTIGLPEGLGIMSTTKNKEASIKFINWWMQPDNQIKIFDQLGLLTCRSSVMTTLISENKIEGGQIVLDEAKQLVSLFPQGVPSWYSQFSIEASNEINAMVKGDMTVDQAAQTLASKVQAMK
jgi:multiple sugar transport system substrate-binding protein